MCCNPQAHGLFVVSQLRSFDQHAPPGGHTLRVCSCPAVQALCEQLGVSAQTRGGGGGGGGGGKRAPKDIRACATKVEWADEGEELSDGGVRHGAALVDGRLLQVR